MFGTPGMFGTRTMLFLFALFAIKAFGLALTLFLSVLESQLIVMSIWSSDSLVLSVQIWFWKRRRKPPDLPKSNQVHQQNINNFRPNQPHPTVTSSLYLHFDYGKRGRRAAFNGGTPAAAAAIRDAAPANHIFLNRFSQMVSNIDQCLAYTADLFEAYVLSLHTGSAFSEINNKNLAVVTIISSNRPVFVVENILQITGGALASVAVLSTVAINSAARIIQSVVLGGETIFHLTIVLKDMFLQGRHNLCHHLCLSSAAMAGAVLKNTIYLLPKESTTSFTSEGATQNIGVTSITATYARTYTYSLVQLLPMI